MLKQIAIPFASAVLGALAVLLVMPAPKPLPANIQAEKITLNGADGLPRVILSGGGDRGPSILLLNREARPALTIAVPDDGDPSIELGEEGGRIFLTSGAGGVAAIVVKDDAGRDRVRVRVDAGGEAAIETIGAEGK